VDTLASRSLFSFACVIAASLALAAPGMAFYEAPAPTTPKTTYVPGQIIVLWEEDASRSDKLAAKRDAEVDSAVTLGDPSFQAVEIEPGQSTSDAIAELEANPAVAVAERDALLAPTSIPNDPLFGQLWALQNAGVGVGGFVGATEGADIDATEAWDQFLPPFAGLPGKGVVVADIDSGYRFEGVELGPVSVPGFDFVGSNADSPSEDSNPTDDNLVSGGHGVHTAGTIGAAGNNETGITGVAQDARIMPLRVCSGSPSNSNALRCPTSSIIAAINYAGSHGARVANISLTNTSPSTLMREALAKNPGTLFVISAGNDGVNNDSVGHHHYPCDYQPGSEVPGAIENVVCVTATDQADKLASFSDWGSTSVDLGAPGTEILSTYPVEDMLSEDPELTNFGIRWTAGLEGGFGRTNEAPLTSFGISDSPEEAPVANSTRESELTTAIAIPSGYGNCQLSGRRFVALGSSGKFTQEIVVNESEVIKATPTSTSGSLMASFAMPPISGLAGDSVKIRFRYEVGSSPTPSNGVWLDDLQFACYQAPTVPPGYAFLQGTSMAAPQVSGTAALMFSLHPEASLTAVRNALLASVDPIASLTGKTVTGGRLDAARALAELDTTAPASPVLATDPASPSSSSAPRIIGSAEQGSTVRVYANAGCAGTPLKELSAAALSSPGVAVTVPSGTTLAFSATATDAGLNVSGCSAVSYTNVSSLSNGTINVQVDPPVSGPSCTVPRVTGKTLAQAKAAIVRAACKVGKVTKPKTQPGRKTSPLVVKSSSPGAGAKPASGVVALKLGPKPKARRH
jgi:subtilisin family serine protease